MALPDAGSTCGPVPRLHDDRDTPSNSYAAQGTMSRSCPGSLLARESGGLNPAPGASGWPSWPTRPNAASRPAHRLLHPHFFCSMTAELQSPIDSPGTTAPPGPHQRAGPLRDAVEHVIAELDAGACAWPSARRGPMDGQPVGEEGGAAVLPPERQPPMGDKDLTFFDKVPTKFAGWARTSCAPPACAWCRRCRARGSFQARTWC